MRVSLSVDLVNRSMPASNTNQAVSTLEFTALGTDTIFLTSFVQGLRQHAKEYTATKAQHFTPASRNKGAGRKTRFRSKTRLIYSRDVI